MFNPRINYVRIIDKNIFTNLKFAEINFWSFQRFTHIHVLAQNVYFHAFLILSKYSDNIFMYIYIQTGEPKII